MTLALDTDVRVVNAVPKGKRARSVPIPEDDETAIRAAWTAAPDACGLRHVKGKCPGPLAVTNEHGTAWDISAFRRAWTSACTLSKIGPTRIHDLRHTCASWLLQSGMSLAEVGQILGHVSATTTQRYAHLAPPDPARITAAVDWRRGQIGGNGSKPGPTSLNDERAEPA